MTREPESIFFLTRSLDVGGGQRQVVVLAKELRERGHRVTVALFYTGGALEADLNGSGVEILDLGKRGRWDLVPFMRGLIGELRRRRPDVIYSFLGASNLLAALARPFVPKTRLVWTILASNMDLSKYDRLWRAAYRVECRLSKTADLIISNSRAGEAVAVRDGFPAEKIVVVPSGVDMARFRPQPSIRATQRETFGLRDSDIAVGVLARLDPMKGYDVLLRAARIVHDRGSDLRFLCIGDGPLRGELQETANELGLGEKVLFAGEQEPVAALNALDICCSCSVWGEGQSNSVAEAMACGLPCVVTDVGDSARLVGSTGMVVPPGSAEALADALMAQAAGLDTYDKSRPIERVREEFSAAVMADETIEAFRAIGKGKPA
jgi:glycosyltransferase involved in cell wall biosynthesis